jgi:hypothetical protein
MPRRLSERAALATSAVADFWKLGHFAFSSRPERLDHTQEVGGLNPPSYRLESPADRAGDGQRPLLVVARRPRLKRPGGGADDGTSVRYRRDLLR